MLDPTDSTIRRPDADGRPSLFSAAERASKRGNCIIAGVSQKREEEGIPTPRKEERKIEALVSFRRPMPSREIEGVDKRPASLTQTEPSEPSK